MFERSDFDALSWFEDSYIRNYSFNLDPDGLPPCCTSNNFNQNTSPQNEKNNSQSNEQNEREQSNNGDISHSITLSAIPEKKDDSEPFDDLDELFGGKISEGKENKNENSLLSQKREKSKNKENKDIKKKN